MKMHQNTYSDIAKMHSNTYTQVRAQYRTCSFSHLQDLEVVPHPPKYLSGTYPFEHLRDLEVVPHPNKNNPKSYKHLLYII